MPQVIVDLRMGEEVVVKTKKRYKTNRKFAAIGLNMISEDKIVSTANIMKELSASANWLLWSLIPIRCIKTNIAEFVITKDTSRDSQRGVRGFKELNMLGLVRKVRKSVYMINPEFIYPDPTMEDYCKEQWNQLGNKERK